MIAPIGHQKVRNDDFSLSATGMDKLVITQVNPDMRIRLSRGIKKNQISRSLQAFLQGWKKKRHVFGSPWKMNAIVAIHIMDQP
jgi:hypothetical protein